MNRPPPPPHPGPRIPEPARDSHYTEWHDLSRIAVVVAVVGAVLFLLFALGMDWLLIAIIIILIALPALVVMGLVVGELGGEVLAFIDLLMGKAKKRTDAVICTHCGGWALLNKKMNLHWCQRCQRYVLEKEET